MRLSLLILLFAVAVGLSAACSDSTSKFKVDIKGTVRNRRCKWVAKKKKRCNRTDITGTLLKDHCPVSCEACPAEPEVETFSDEPETFSAGLGCCTLDYKVCINWCGETEESCNSCSNTDVGWIPNGAPSGNCAARWVGCGNDPKSCCAGLTCQESNGWFSCTPESAGPNPTNPPQPSPTEAPVPPTVAPVPPTTAPVPPTAAPVPPTAAPVPPTTAPVPPTTAPVPPTVAPVPPTTAPVPLPTSSGSGCCTLDYKECINWCGDTEDSCNSCSNSDVGWIPNGAPTGNCVKRWEGCGTSPNSCCPGLTCQESNGWFSCTPGGDSTPTNPPQASPTVAPVEPTMAPVPPTTAPVPPTTAPVPPTTAPVPPTTAPIPPTQAPVEPTMAPVPPTTAPVPPTVAPVPPTTAPVPPTTAPVPPTAAPVPSGNGCCSLDYKNCVTWCGDTEHSCNTCGNQEVVWLPNGAENDTCGERWVGCGQDNDNNHSGCCNGLTCQWRGDGHDYFACLPPGDGTPTPPTPPTNPPQSSPTNAPQQSPVSSPTTGGVGDWISGKATMYGGNPSGGACGYNDLPQVSFPFGLSVAIGGDEFDNGYGCGACYEVTCHGPATDNPGCFCGEEGQNTVIVQATDQCPECDSTHLDLNTAAFTSFVKDQDPGMAGTCGIVETSFRRVSCDFKSNIKIRSKGGTSGFWYGLHVDDVAGYGAIQSVKLREAGRRQNGQNDFDIVCRKSENASFWLCDRPNGRQIFANLDVELTDSAGRVLRSNDVITNLGGGEEFDFGQNYDPIPDGTPTAAPVAAPTQAPAPTPAPAPTTPFNGELLSTDKAMNAWEVYQGLDYITHKNSENPPNYALVASGGAAGGGNLVVSESQAYSLLITGTVLASWDTHAGQVSGANRNEVLKSFEGYYNFWKEMCKNSSGNNANCQPGGNYCKSGSNSYVCLPDWRHYKTGGSESTGPAPDADEDAIVGIILAVKAVENDANKPSWYDEARKWADASATAFYDFEVDKSKPDYRLVKLGSCWGGWGSAGNNPSYHGPGAFRVMKDYQNSFPNSDRSGYSAVSQSDWQKLIDTSHEVMQAVQCSNDGALVPNWATMGVSGGNIIHTGEWFSGSGTPQYEYGAEAARTTFRVALDAAFYPEMSAEWSPYLSSFNYRLDGSYSGGSFSGNAFPSCKTPNTSQNINMFGDWLNNEFIFGPTVSALIGASSDITNAQVMIDSAGEKLAGSLPGSYYPRSWAMIANLMLNGAMESAGGTLKA